MSKRKRKISNKNRDKMLLFIKNKTKKGSDEESNNIVDDNNVK